MAAARKDPVNCEREVTVICQNHRDLLVDGLCSFLSSQHGTDIDLQWGSGSVRAHRLIVEIFMPTVQQAASAHSPPAAAAELRSADGRDCGQLQFLLEFLYQGSVTVKERELDRLHKLAKHLRFKALSDAVESTMIVEAASSLGIRLGQRSTAGGSVRPIRRCRKESLFTTASHQPETAPSSSIEKRPRRIDRAEPTKKFDGARRDPTNTKPELQIISATGSVSNTVAASRDPLAKAQRLRRWTERNPTLRCERCHFKSRSKKHFRSHLARHDGASGLPCQVTFESHTLTLATTTAAAAGSLRCAYCEFETPKQWKYVYHLKAVHEVNLKGEACPLKYHCQDCSQSFVCLSVLNVHRRIKHTKDRPYKCDLCAYASSRKGDLGIHVKVSHLKLRPLMCETCGYRAISVSSLSRHRRRHTGEKPFQCHECGHSFADTTSLKRHARRHGSSDRRPYVCRLCGRAFSERYILNVHLRKGHHVFDDCQQLLPEDVEGVQPPDPVSATGDASSRLLDAGLREARRPGDAGDT